MIRTRINDLLNVRYPVLQGGMAWVSTASLVSAVSEAGGLGIIGAGGMTPEELRENIRQVKTNTSYPFGVNLMLLSPDINEHIEVVKKENVPVVTTGAGNPGSLIKEFEALHILTIPVVSSVMLAKRLERLGARAVIAEGLESGGHIGEVTTMCLMPQMVDALDIPVIAAGGIADGRGIVASLALGAEGVQLGTRFVCSEECNVHVHYKESILKATDRSTVTTGVSTGHPVRCLRNRLTRKFQELEGQGVCREEIEKMGAGCLKLAVCDGDVQEGSVMAGQISGLIHDIKPVQAIISSMMDDVVRVIDKLGRLVEV